MKRILVILFLLFSTPALATTWYVREDGGDSSECTGQTDAAYPGSGTGQDCAFEHPNWAISPVGNDTTTLMVGGDTLIIDGSDSANYQMGYGSPNSADGALCYSGAAYHCYWEPVPSGTDAEHPTRILGKGWDSGCSSPPELWGVGDLYWLISLDGSDYVEIQCLDLTDHESCGYESGTRDDCVDYTDSYARVGIYGNDSSNVLIKNVDMHGFISAGIESCAISDWTLDNVHIAGTGSAGWKNSLDDPGCSNSGDIQVINGSSIMYAGCVETYPGLEYVDCGDAYGDGLGMSQTSGDWYFEDFEMGYSTSDGIDLLYTVPGSSVTCNRCYLHDNSGNQLKTSTDTIIENSLLIGNCDYYTNGAGSAVVYNGVDDCRAGGPPLSFEMGHAGQSFTIKNSTVSSRGAGAIEIGNSREQINCDGTELFTIQNSIIVGNGAWDDDPQWWWYLGGTDSNGGGECGATDPVDYSVSYSIFYNYTFGSGQEACPSGDGVQCPADPLLVDSPTDDLLADPYLTASSPARDAADETIECDGLCSVDYNNYPRGASWDIGGLEYGSVPTGGPVPYCGDGTADVGEDCDTSDLNSETCVTLGFDSGTLSCNGDCTFNTSSCVTASCGNGIVESVYGVIEECDDGNNTNGDGCSSICEVEGNRRVGVSLSGCSLHGGKIGR